MSLVNRSQIEGLQFRPKVLAIEFFTHALHREASKLNIDKVSLENNEDNNPPGLQNESKNCGNKSSSKYQYGVKMDKSLGWHG